MSSSGQVRSPLPAEKEQLEGYSSCPLGVEMLRAEDLQRCNLG